MPADIRDMVGRKNGGRKGELGEWRVERGDGEEWHRETREGIEVGDAEEWEIVERVVEGEGK